MSERVVTPTDAHRAFRDDAIALLRKHAGELDARDMLALSAHLVGQIAAMQDQRTTSPALAMKIIAKNIEVGNGEAIGNLMAPSGRT